MLIIGVVVEGSGSDIEEDLFFPSEIYFSGTVVVPHQGNTGLLRRMNFHIYGAYRYRCY